MTERGGVIPPSGNKYFVVATFGAVGHQTRVNILQPQINIGRPAWDNLPVYVEERMR